MLMYIGATVPFADAYKLSSHFVRHGHKFGATTEAEYERMAEEFMSKPITADVYECTSTTGMYDRNRLEGTTLYFGVAYNVNVIRTFLPREAGAVAKKGGPMGFVLSKCAEVKN